MQCFRWAGREKILPHILTLHAKRNTPRQRLAIITTKPVWASKMDNDNHLLQPLLQFVGRRETILFPGSGPNPVQSVIGGWQPDVCSPQLQFCLSARIKFCKSDIMAHRTSDRSSSLQTFKKSMTRSITRPVQGIDPRTALSLMSIDDLESALLSAAEASALRWGSKLKHFPVLNRTIVVLKWVHTSIMKLQPVASTNKNEYVGVTYFHIAGIVRIGSLGIMAKQFNKI